MPSVVWERQVSCNLRCLKFLSCNVSTVGTVETTCRLSDVCIERSNATSNSLHVFVCKSLRRRFEIVFFVLVCTGSSFTKKKKKDKKRHKIYSNSGPTPTNGRFSVKLGQSLPCPEVTLSLLVSSSACVFMLRGVARRGERVIFSIESTLVRQTSKEKKEEKGLQSNHCMHRLRR